MKKAEEGSAERPAESQPAQAEAKEDPVQKELEAKKKEAIDLTVCSR